MDDMIFGRRYRITERIGSGGMAEVYKAVDETLGRTVAVKVLHSRFSMEPDFIQRFRHEASAAANLSHPSIVNIYDYGVENDNYYIVMELVRGTDLKAVVRQRGMLEPLAVAEYGAQACSALSVAHGYGIIHRDIKPQNIVLTPDGTIKVMDFGIARAVDSDSTQTGSVLGSAQYVSPEQAQGKKLAPQSDLYSLGVVLYELATGRLPFDGDTPVSVALKHVNEEPVPPRQLNPAIPPALEAVILRAMQKDPRARYSSAEEMRSDLLRVAAGRPVDAQPRVEDTTVMPVVPSQRQPQGSRSETRRRRTSPWVWAGVAALVVLAVIGAAWALGLFSTGLRVPPVAGMTVEAAKQAILDAGLVPGNEDTRPDPEIAAGLVISSDPAAGQVVEKGQRVDLVVSSGPELVTVPSVIGSTESSAIATLQELGFDVDPMITREFNAKYESGMVFKTDPLPNSKLPKGGRVRLWVSEGAEMVSVPLVVDQTQAEATKALNDAGFSVKVVARADSSVSKGTVVEQRPTGGSQAAKGSAVTIYVSSGPAQVSVPDLTDMTQTEAVARLESLGLASTVLQVQDSDPAKTGRVQDQDPSPGTKVNKGASVTIWIARLP